MSSCKQCGKVVAQKEGKRERKFCSNTCRQKNYQLKKRKTPVLEEGKLYSWVGGQLIEAELPNIPIAQTGKQDEIMTQMELAKLKLNNPSGVSGKCIDISELDPDKPYFETKPPYEILDNSEIEAKIKAIQSEKIPSHRDTSRGRKVWQIEQTDKINELKRLLQNKKD